VLGAASRYNRWVMRIMFRIWLAAVCLLFVGQARAADDLERLVRRADMIMRGETSAAVFEMEIKTKHYQRNYKVIAWDDHRQGEKTLIKILGPASWRGFGTLKIGDQLKIYDPKTNHVQRVGHSMLGDSWMGSHFSNDDLVKETRLSRDYKLRLVKKFERDGTHYLVEMTPNPNAPVAWGRIVYQVHQQGELILPVTAKYYRKRSDEKAARTMTFSDIKELGGRRVPATMTVRIARKPGEFTRITYTKLRLNLKIPKAKFSEQALRH
jgi:hypothetical protein